MSTIARQFTYQDAIDHLLDVLGGNPQDTAERDARRAVQQAYRELTNARSWSYYIAHGRIVLSAPYSTGTLSYDHTGGEDEREAILHGGTWPDWAGSGASLRVGDVVYRVDERVDATHLTLTRDLNPGADVDLERVGITGVTAATPIVVTSMSHGLTTGDTVIIEGARAAVVDGTISVNGTWVVTVLDDDTFELDDSVGADDDAWLFGTGAWRLPPTTTYTLFRDTYLLPEDFIQTGTPFGEDNFGGLIHRHPEEWLWDQKTSDSLGTPTWFTVVGDGQFAGRLVFKVFPAPDSAEVVDYIYHRRPRPLVRPMVDAGTVTITAGDTTVSGLGTTWTQQIVGTAFRVGTPLDAPTSLEGEHPAQHESLVKEVVSETELRLVDAPADGFELARYTASDPVDVEPGAMLTAFLRGAEYFLAVARRDKDRTDALGVWKMALREAMANDVRSFQGRSALSAGAEARAGPGRAARVAVEDAADNASLAALEATLDAILVQVAALEGRVAVLESA